MSLVLQVDILGEYKQLTAATKGAQSQLSALNKRTKKISDGMNKAFAAIGIGFSLNVIKNELEEAAKAAIEDAKSMNLLALAMKNTAGATKSQIAEAEKAISQMSIQAGIADDDLRPAYQKLFIATKDVTESNKLLKIAMDASAATGKDLDTVALAMAKSLAGSDTALVKLIPSLKGAKDPIGELEKAFKGASDEAANTDPYARMQVIFGEMQEQIGAALLPTLKKFSTWLTTPEGKEKLQAIVDLLKNIVTEFGNTVNWILDNKDWLLPVVAALGVLKTAWKGVTVGIGVAQAAQKLFAAEAVVQAGIAQTAWLGVAAVIAGITWAGVSQGAAEFTSQIESQNPNVVDFAGESVRTGKTGTIVPKTTVPNVKTKRSVTYWEPRTGQQKPSTNITMNIKSTQSAQQIAQALNKQLKSTGSSTVIRGGR